MKKKILLLANHGTYVYSLRKEIIQSLINNQYDVYLSFPADANVDYFTDMGCNFIDTKYDRHGKNPVQELRLMKFYYDMINKLKPDVVLTYTIKPNLYGSFICSWWKIPYIVNITGLGTAVENEGYLQKMITFLYRKAFKNAHTVFMQNTENQQYFIDNKIAADKLKLLPGSGVNIDKYKSLSYPDDNIIKFLYIARVMKEKGIDQYLDAAEFIKLKYPNTEFHIVGFCEDSYEEKLNHLQNEGVIQYHGLQTEVLPFIELTHCTILPTYYPEGMSNVLLESAASARPLITTNRSGCREIVDNNINGYIIKPMDSDDLIEKIEKFIELNFESKEQMGLAGRKKVENEFDRKIVVEAYLNQILELEDRNII